MNVSGFQILIVIAIESYFSFKLVSALTYNPVIISPDESRGYIGSRSVAPPPP